MNKKKLKKQKKKIKSKINKSESEMNEDEFLEQYVNPEEDLPSMSQQVVIQEHYRHKGENAIY